MAETPVEIRKRPFSVESFTGVMLPDGIFDTALKSQKITTHVTNTSGAALRNVRVYLEAVGDPGVAVVAKTYEFPEVPSGASVRVDWLADFSAATPGKKLVSIMVDADGADPRRILKTIFVSQTKRNPVTGEYTCTVEEGTLRVSKLEMIHPKGGWRPCRENPKDQRKDCPPSLGPWIPSGMTMVFEPNPAYEGVHGELPFADPWWKVLGWIVAAIAAIVAIVAAALGEGTAGTAISGTFDETTGDISCCEPDPGGVPGGDELTVAGVASVIATAAVAVGLADDADPWWRGQEATVPPAGALTTAERVEARFDYPDGQVVAGKPYSVAVEWKYFRVTSAGNLDHAVAEVRKNEHLHEGVEVVVPGVHHTFQGPLVIRARIYRSAGKPYSGEDLFVFCLLKSPDGLFIRVDLADDGIGADEAANDGVYTGSVDLRKAYKVLLKRGLTLEGQWRVYLFAQDINDATPDMLPHVAATRIGGFAVASGISINFDPTLPCPLESQATFAVVV